MSNPVKTATLPEHLPPGNLNDLSTANKELWSTNYISEWMSEEIRGGLAGPACPGGSVITRTPLSQFFDGTVTPFDVDQTPNTSVEWKAFPNRVQTAYPDDTTRWAIADYSRQVQDEYLEWSASRDGNNHITSVTFTCEGPEYWQFIADYQDGETEGTDIVTLYNQLNPIAKIYTGPGGIQKEDIYIQDQKTKAMVYNPANYFNISSTTGTIAHLVQPNNSLSAEIDIVAQGTVLRIKDGKPVTNAVDLINCSKYGQVNRNSDPTIGISANNVARAGNALSIADPVALYIRSFDLSNFTLDGTPIEQIPGLVQWTRGDISKQMGLRVTISIPDDYNEKRKATKGTAATVSDIYDGNTGQNVSFAAQFVDWIMIGVGVVVIPNFPVASAQPCPCDCGASRSMAELAVSNNTPVRKHSTRY